MKISTQAIFVVTAVLLSATGAEEVIYAQVEETVTLKPPGMIHLQNYYLFWYFGELELELELVWRNNFGGTGFNEKWKDLLSLSDDSLIIKHIKQEHFGTFSCKVMSSDYRIVAVTTYKLFKLNVSMKPPSPLLPGESLSLVCDAESPLGHEKPQIHWLNPQGEEMKNSLGVRATGQHSGQWTCVVTNDDKVNKVKISVTVVDLCPAPLHPQYTSESSPLTIPCLIPSHISWDQIKTKGIQGGSWHFFPEPGSRLHPNEPQRLFSLSLEDPPAWRAHRGRGLTPAPDLQKGVLSLTRHRGREGDRGDYVCSLEFRNGVTLNRTVHINVLEIISSPGTDLVSGQRVNLTCSLGHPLPSDLRVKWFPPEKSSLSSVTSDNPSAHLTVREVGTGDGGTWRCELWQSNTRLTSAEITLMIEPKMSLWMLVIACSVTAIGILFLTLIYILYRRRQRKMRHPRHRLCQCKNPKPKGLHRT